MIAAQVVVLGVSLVIILVITAVVTLVWRKRVLRQRDERRDKSAEYRYRLAAEDLRRLRDDAARYRDRKAARQTDPPETPT